MGRKEEATSRPRLQVAAVLNNNGVMLLEHERGDAEGARQQFLRATQIAPNYTIGFVNLGIASLALPQPDYDAAIAALDKAEQLGMNSPQLYYARGIARFQKQDYAGAEKDFRQVAQKEDSDAFVHYHLGMALSRQNRLEEAITELKAAIARLPNFQSAYYALGQAYQRAGRLEEAAKAFTKWSELEASQTGVKIGAADYFASKGKYLEPIIDARAPKRVAVGPMVVFSDSTDKQGLSIATTAEQTPFIAAWGDAENDGKPDLLLAQGSKVTLLDNNGSRLTPRVGTSLAYPGRISGACWGDYNNDGNTDLLLYGNGGIRLFQNIGNGKFRDRTASLIGSWTGRLSVKLVQSIQQVSHAIFTDFNHDGFLDIFVCYANASCALFRNNGGATFKDVSLPSGVHSAQGSYALPTDYNRDRAVDLLIVSERGKPVLLRNNYNGTFAPVRNAAGLESISSTRQIAAADLNSDGLIDYIAASEQGLTIAIHLPNNTFQIRPVLPERGGVKALAVNIADFDNDGAYDMVALRDGGGEARLRCYRGNGDGTFIDVTAGAGLNSVRVAREARVVLADVDSNGFPDILVTGAQPSLFQNGGNGNRWIRLNLRGLKASPESLKRRGARANGGGIGATVEAWTDASWLMTEITTSSGNDTQPTMGLGAGESPRWVRILWPSGVHQCEAFAHGGVQQATFKNQPLPLIRPNQTATLWEPDRNPTSCPLLYVWDGKHYRFITDLQGGAIVGYNIGAYRYNVPDPDEYVLVSGEAFGLKDGSYSIEIANQLQEVLFIDAVHLLAVDHPALTRVFSNDRMLAKPPFPKFEVCSVEETRPLKAAKDDSGKDVLPLLADIDRKYPQNFKRLPYQGFTQPHTLTLDLGSTRGAKQVLLLLYGWQDYAHSSSNLAAAHAGVYGKPPRVQVLDRAGRWRTVIPDMGSVAGLPKWLAVDLTGQFLCEDRRVRILTNLSLYWDKIEVGLRYRDVPLHLTRLTPSRADYHWLGYPTPTYPDGRDPVIYDYDRRRPSAPWAAPVGYYTRPGDVTELLQKPEDRYVIMRHGFAIRIAFDPKRLPSLPPGWKRDFILYSEGFGKDMDVNGAESRTVGPLPFHSMSRYPYGPEERYPTDRAHTEYRARYNTVYESGVAAIAPWPELYKAP